MSSQQPIRWGILGSGGIARKFATSAAALDATEVVAVASASSGKAGQFASEFGIGKGYDSYEALLDDASVDAVYVANTHNFHHETVCQAIRAGKPVLCEKPNRSWSSR